MRGHQQAGRTQGVEQGTCLVGRHPYGPGVGEHGAFAAGAVQQVEQVGCAWIGQLQQHGGPRADAELERVPVSPESAEAGQQSGPGQCGTAHDDEG
ncbi:hypothetical protein GCM10027614_60710 [Micromonospora vulcania]